MEYIGTAKVTFYNEEKRDYTLLQTFIVNSNTKEWAVTALKLFVKNIPLGLNHHHEIELEVSHNTLMECYIVWRRYIEVSKNKKLIWHKN